MKISIRIKLAVRCLGLIGGALLGSQVFAANPTDPPSVTVKYADLNLQAPAGIEALYRRIHGAAIQVCDSGDGRNPSIVMRDRKCTTSAETQAIEKVHNAALSAFYQRKVGGPNARVAMSNGK